MTGEREPPDLRNLGDRLRQARGRSEGTPTDPERPPNQMGLALRVVTEMAAALFVGGMLGYGIDSWLGTRPWGLLILLVLGAAAGMRGAFREARRASGGGEDGGEDGG